MASSVDVVPALGHGLVASQSGPSAGYDAIDDRRFWSVGLQEGAISAGSYEVTQRAAGANLSVDVAASTGDGALVQGDSVTLQALYRVAAHTAVINVDIAAASVSNPRVDRVILEVKDDAHDVGGLNIARVRVVTGTATAGATLDNLTGAAAVPSSALLLADVLVPTSDTTISNSQIRDRRTWARGAYHHIIRSTNAAAGNDYTVTSASGLLEYIDAVNLAPRIECSGVPVRLTLRGGLYCTLASQAAFFSPQMDGVGINGMSNVGAAPGSGAQCVDFLTTRTTTGQWIELQWNLVPSAGSHVFAPTWTEITASDSLILKARATLPCEWIVEELVRQNVKNNTTTTG